MFSQINKSDTAKIFNHSTFHLHRLSISNLSCIYQEKTAMTLSKIKKNNSWTVLNTKHLIGYKTLHAHMEDIKQHKKPNKVSFHTLYQIPSRPVFHNAVTTSLRDPIIPRYAPRPTEVFNPKAASRSDILRYLDHKPLAP